MADEDVFQQIFQDFVMDQGNPSLIGVPEPNVITASISSSKTTAILDVNFDSLKDYYVFEFDKIYATGLPTNLTKEDIATFFGSIGAIKNICQEIYIPTQGPR